jgi:hypothetical protein
MIYLLYALTLFVSSSLLFLVQPMVGKMLLPVLGGSPAVWNTCMVFFQAVLLLGYLYAHATTRWLGSRRQAPVHLAVMAIGLLFLPIGMASPGGEVLESPALWLVGALLVAVGWPFFVISTSAPLLQKWFSNTNHPHAADPYHLYAASNVGSVLALIAYPLVVEPRLGLKAQTIAWAILYVVLIALIALCATVLWRAREQAPAAQTAARRQAAPLDWARRGRWVLWSFIPSSMMLGATTFITTDVAPIPLLWIVPLTIYLVSFIIVFARHQILRVKHTMVLFPLALVALGVVLFWDVRDPLGVITGIHFAALFIFALLFHGLVAEDRPETDYLTEFFLWISVGGVLGGTFNALLAPLVFDRLLEYPLIVLMAALTVPAAQYARLSVRLALGVALTGGALYIGWWYDLHEGIEGTQQILSLLLLILSVALPITVAFWRPQSLPASLAFLSCFGLYIFAQPSPNTLHLERSFFAVHEVAVSRSGDYHFLYNGTTQHGVQSRVEPYDRVPMSYYYLTGPLGQVFEELSKRERRHAVAAVGMGTGAVAAYTRPGQTMTFYEIDAAVVRIAKNPDYFSYLTNCEGTCEVVLGDGRLQLAQAPAKRYELIILDAYSSTAIPFHLLTKEAVEMYLDKLTDDGIIAFHISNRHLDLEPALTSLAQHMGLVSRYQDFRSNNDEYNAYVDGSDWLLMARSTRAFGPLAFDDRWVEFGPSEGVRIWTDDYAAIIQAYRFPYTPFWSRVESLLSR